MKGISLWIWFHFAQLVWLCKDSVLVFLSAMNSIQADHCSFHKNKKLVEILDRKVCTLSEERVLSQKRFIHPLRPRRTPPLHS